MDPPTSTGYGYGYFDDIHLVEFEKFSNPNFPLTFPRSISKRYIAITTDAQENNTVLNFRTKRFEAPDTDNDGLYDCLEDFNNSGIIDSQETDPLSIDTDNDGLTDLEEFIFGSDRSITDGSSVDTDNDGYDDYSEFSSHTNPNDPNSHPTGPTITPSPSPTRLPDSPTPTPTHTLTPMHTPTPFPSPTALTTYTPTPPPTPTESQTSTPMSTPTMTPSESAQAILSIILSSDHFIPHENCWVKLDIQYNGLPFWGDLYFLLECYGSFWSWPSWIPSSDGIDYNLIFLKKDYHTLKTIISPFQLPEDTQPAGPFAFYSAIFRHEYLSIEDIRSNVAMASFFIGY